jgi:hypothetical protein
MSFITEYCTGTFGSCVTSVQGYKFLIFHTSHSDTLYLREQGCENPWLIFEVKRGLQVKKFRGKLHYKNKQRFESRGVKRRTGLYTLADSLRILPLASCVQRHKVPPKRR